MDPSNDREREALLAKYGAKPVTFKNLLSQLDALAPVIVDSINKRMAPLLKRIEQLEKDNAQLAEQKLSAFADSYRGTWQPGPHQRGAMVTWEGSLFLCWVDTEAKPGTNGDWRLVVKRGRDGKDLRG